MTLVVPSTGASCCATPPPDDGDDISTSPESLVALSVASCCATPLPTSLGGFEERRLPPLSDRGDLTSGFGVKVNPGLGVNVNLGGAGVNAKPEEELEEVFITTLSLGVEAREEAGVVRDGVCIISSRCGG